jgi:hypothetical protein
MFAPRPPTQLLRINIAADRQSSHLRIPVNVISHSG